MELWLTAVLMLTVSVHGAVKFPEEDGVVVLTNETFDGALQQFPQLFVEFCSYQTNDTAVIVRS